jgi:imidazolonepropionase
MRTLFIDISSLVTVNSSGKNIKSGSEMSDIAEIKDGAVLFGQEIEWIGTSSEAREKISRNEIHPDEIVGLNGKTVLPGFADSHTHIVFAGNRSNEFARRLRGATYQEIANEGGGILTTMNATRKASVEELAETGLKLAESAIKNGTTSIEIKSGYGLSPEAELKQLRAIKIIQEKMPMLIVPTFLGAHDIPPEYRDNREKYIDIICNEMIPEVAGEGLALYCDAFIDKGYYTLPEGEKILRSGLDHGMKLKVHCDELADVGATGLAAGLGAVSADHLLFVNDEGISAMKESGTIASLLPGTAYFIRMPYAPARKIIENGNAVALATDCNPGSSFTENMQAILSLAAINMRMSMEECISAATINGAAAMGLNHKTGSIESGKRADLAVFNVPSYTDIFYHFGLNHVEQSWIAGHLYC